MSILRFTRRQLALYNGQDKPKIYVAYQGDVFDVTSSRYWRRGLHFAHWAGQDLTLALLDAPHGWEVFSRYPRVGILIDEPPRP